VVIFKIERATATLAQIETASFWVVAGAKRRSQPKRYSGKLEIATIKKSYQEGRIYI